MTIVGMMVGWIRRDDNSRNNIGNVSNIFSCITEVAGVAPLGRLKPSSFVHHSYLPTPRTNGLIFRWYSYFKFEKTDSLGYQTREARILKSEELRRIKSSPLPARPGRSSFDSTLRPHEQFKNLTSGRLTYQLPGSQTRRSYVLVGFIDKLYPDWQW